VAEFILVPFCALFFGVVLGLCGFMIVHAVVCVVDLIDSGMQTKTQQDE
jgi:hypothetical protein